MIDEVPSHSGNGKDKPMKLRASYSEDAKLATLVHELGHILLIDNDIKAEEGQDIHDALFFVFV
jgi:Zn-dependent peptidase ImmA (M78 family)